MSNVQETFLETWFNFRYLPDMGRIEPPTGSSLGETDRFGFRFPGVKPTWRILEGELEEPSNFEDSKILKVPRKQTTFTWPACEFYAFTLGKEAQKFGRFAHVKHPCQGTMAAHGPEISKLPGHIGMANSWLKALVPMNCFNMLQRKNKKKWHHEIPYLKDSSIRKAGNHVFFKKKSCDQSTGLIANGRLMALTV